MPSTLDNLLARVSFQASVEVASHLRIAAGVRHGSVPVALLDLSILSPYEQAQMLALLEA